MQANEFVDVTKNKCVARYVTKSQALQENTPCNKKLQKKIYR